MSHGAGATVPVGPVGVATPWTATRLPDGIHINSQGRFTRDLCDHSKRFHCLTQILLPETWTPDQPVPRRDQDSITPQISPPANQMGPTDILTAYGIPANTAANGKIVAILDMPDSHALTDVNAYRSAFGIPTLPACSGMPTGTLPACFAQVTETGGTPKGDGGSSADGETSLDMDMISAACPDCSILLVTFPRNGPADSDFIKGAQEAASLGAVATSISWGGPEYQGDPVGYTTPGHLVLAATGDDAYDFTDYPGYPATPSYPSSAPDVVAVGGTTLFYYSGPKYDEAVYFATTGPYGDRGTTSGCSTEFATPPWQVSALAGSGCNNRATADVAAAASFSSGGVLTDIACYESGSGGGGWGTLGSEGTSASSPMIAAFLTRLGLAETVADTIAGGTTNWIYANPTAFNDLGSTSYPVDPNGSSTNSFTPSSCGVLCSAEPGWDGPSGMGTPNGAELWNLSGGATDAGIDAGSDSGSSSSSSTSSSSASSSSTSSSSASTTSSSASTTSSSASTTSSTTSSSASATSSSSSTGSSSASTASGSSSSSSTSSVSSSSSASGSGSGSSSSGGVDGGVDSGYDSGGLLIVDSSVPGYDSATIGSSTSGTTTASSSKQPVGTKDSGTIAPSADGAVADAAGSPAGSSGGCSCTESSESRSGWSNLGWLSVGLLALAQRRRRGRKS